MEKSPKRVQDKTTQDNLDFIFQNALGSPIIKDAVPTNATMKANTIAYYDSVIYIKLANGETKKFTVTDVT